jgi:hypothetical protein
VPLAVRQQAPLLECHSPRKAPTRRAQFSSHEYLLSYPAKVGMRGRCRWAQKSGESPHPLALLATSPASGRGERIKLRENNRNRSRDTLLCPSLAHHHAKKIRLPRGKRSAERRMPSTSADRRQVNANLRPSSATRLRALLGARPPFGAHACGTRHCHPDGSAPGPGFPKTDFASVLPAWPN